MRICSAWTSGLLFQLAILSGLMVLQTSCTEQVSTYYRKPRSIKSDYQKDGGRYPGGILREMHDKIHNLESSVKNISLQLSSAQTKAEKISSQRERQEESRAQQWRMLGMLNNEFENLKRVLSGHGEILGNLEQLATVDDDFVLSNNTCGGALVGHSGSILLSRIQWEFRYQRQTSCIWTIQTNNRKSVKVTASVNASSSSTSSTKNSQTGAYIIEVIEKPATNHSSATNLLTKITKVGERTHVICTGPVVFVAYMFTNSDYNYNIDIDPFELNYVGLGKQVEKNTYFSHRNLSGRIGNFSNDQMESWLTVKEQINETFILDYTLLTLPSFNTKTYLQVLFKNGTCGAMDTSFVVVTDLLGNNNVKIIDCCQQSCWGNNSLVSYDSPFVIFIKKRFQVPLNFEIYWQAEKSYSCNSGSYYSSKCGEVVGGVSGHIRYNFHTKYANRERCVWTILPQPGPRSSITIQLLFTGITDSSDHLYMMELTNVNGTELSDGPKITHLRSYQTHVATSRELYIVFYSDSTQVGKGFSLKWESSGQLLKTDQHVMKNFTNMKTDSGLSTSIAERPSTIRTMYQVFIFTPFTNAFELQLQISQTTRPKLSSLGSCLDNDITVYASDNGIFQKRDMNGTCNTEQITIIKVPDSMAMIVLKDKNPDLPPAVINFSWLEEYGEIRNDHIIVDNDECGGVIKGDKGLLRYKTDRLYFNNENCIWLLQSSNHAQITLELLKDGFERCCDNILVSTINPSNGTLRNDSYSVVIDAANPKRTFDHSLLVIAFRSDSGIPGTGFTLKFTGHGAISQATQQEYSYQLRHYSEPSGQVLYPSPEWQDAIPGKKEILVIAASVKINDISETTPSKLPFSIGWSSGVFKRDAVGDDDDDCTYESITFYGQVAKTGWLAPIRLPSQNETWSCPSEITVPKRSRIFTTTYSAFLAIYRHMPMVVEEQDQHIADADTKIGFTFDKSAGCGGVITGDVGEITYKLRRIYANNEKCVWLVDAPQARKIQFTLDESGLQICCDLLYIHSINHHGTLGPASFIQRNKTTSVVVDGPVAVVVFTSDGCMDFTYSFGFRLSYLTKEIASHPLKYSFQLEHHHEVNKSHSYNYEVEENQIVVTAFSMDRALFNIISPPKVKINVTSLRAQIDENCHSDMLTVYNVMGVNDTLKLSKSFSAVDVLKGEARERVVNQTLDDQCSPLQNSLYSSCNGDISNCVGDAPEDNIVSMNGTAFVAIFKSVHVSTGTLEHRGFSIVSNVTVNSSIVDTSLHIC